MNVRRLGSRIRLLAALAMFAASSNTLANTLTQNVSWTIDRAGTNTKYRNVAYGDSIYSGYNGSITNAAKYSAPTVDAEYLSAPWNADIESVRRAKSGAVASDVYNNKIVAERSYMQATSTRVVTFEMCGNDGLQARSSSRARPAPAATPGWTRPWPTARPTSRRRWTTSTPTPTPAPSSRSSPTCTTLATPLTTCKAPAGTRAPARRSTCRASSCPRWRP